MQSEKRTSPRSDLQIIVPAHLHAPEITLHKLILDLSKEIRLIRCRINAYGCQRVPCKVIEFNLSAKAKNGKTEVSAALKIMIILIIKISLGHILKMRWMYQGSTKLIEAWSKEKNEAGGNEPTDLSNKSLLWNSPFAPVRGEKKASYSKIS